MNTQDVASVANYVCPECKSTKTLIRFCRPLPDGTKRRRMICSNCRHRWTIAALFFPRRAVPSRTNTLNEADVRRILTERGIGHLEMALELGVSTELIRRTRIGEHYRHLCPELDRWQRGVTVNCSRCHHWSARGCQMGFPDPITEGLGFASDCDFYSPP